MPRLLARLRHPASRARTETPQRARVARRCISAGDGTAGTFPVLRACNHVRVAARHPGPLGGDAKPTLTAVRVFLQGPAASWDLDAWRLWRHLVRLAASRAGVEITIVLPKSVRTELPWNVLHALVSRAEAVGVRLLEVHRTKPALQGWRCAEVATSTVVPAGPYSARRHCRPVHRGEVSNAGSPLVRAVETTRVQELHGTPSAWRPWTRSDPTLAPSSVWRVNSTGTSTRWAPLFGVRLFRSPLCWPITSSGIAAARWNTLTGISGRHFRRGCSTRFSRRCEELLNKDNRNPPFPQDRRDERGS